MKSDVRWAPTALRELRKLERRDSDRIVRAVDRLAAEGVGDVVRLSGTAPPEFRLRVGDFRIRFGRDAENGVLVILHVLDRKEAYR